MFIEDRQTDGRMSGSHDGSTLYHPRIEISIKFLMLMHKKVGFSGFLCFLGIDANAKVVYTGYRQMGESPEVVAGWRKPERGLKLGSYFYDWQTDGHMSVSHDGRARAPPED